VTTPKGFAQAAKSVLVLPFLLAALLAFGFGFHANTATHTTHISASHYVADVDPVPPGH
jgi:hypothetical protein